MAETQRRVLRLWRDPKVGLCGVARFQQKLAQRGIAIHLAELKQILQGHAEHELFEPRSTRVLSKEKIGNTIVEEGVGTGWQADLVDMGNLARMNQGYAWILNVIDVFSRFVWAVPLKKKSAAEMDRGLKLVLQQAKRIPKRITTDLGKEFQNHKVRALFEQHGIEHFANGPDQKTTLSIVERFNRTLRNLCGRNFARIGRLNWVADLPALISNYNHSQHRGINAALADVWLGRTDAEHKVPTREQFLLSPGTHVRTLIKRQLFEKRAGSQQWSDAIYTVAYREGFRYRVKNSHGNLLDTRYRPSELKTATEIHRDTSGPDEAHRSAKKTRKLYRTRKRQNLDISQILRTRLRKRSRQSTQHKARK